MAAPLEPVLDVNEIQGNSLAGFNKDYQTLVFVQIRDAGKFRPWLKSAAPAVATLAQVNAFNRLFRSMAAALDDDPQGLSATWMNLAFSSRGIRKLVDLPVEQQLQDNSFQSGQFQQSELLGDPPDRSGWKVGGSEETEADLLVILASDSAAALKARVVAVRRGLLNSKAVKILWTQAGATLPGDLRGHEHFGFRDGISQPSPRGRVSEQPQDFLTPRAFADGDERSLRFARAGRRLVWPGQFVLGYPRQDDADDVQALDPVEYPEFEPEWAKNGSYVVFRRLRQNVKRFWDFMKSEAAALAATPEFAGWDHVRLAANLVGRWPDGTPVVLSPGGPDGALVDADRINDFTFREQDEAGLRCPMSAHIRKANTRDDPVDDGGPRRMLTRLVLRRGIPYGAVEDDDKGLLFVCYQRSIAAQFEFLINHWANAEELPRAGSGHDPIIGQKPPDRARTIHLRTASQGNPFGVVRTIPIPNDFVEATGGGYFFSPAASVLKRWGG